MTKWRELDAAEKIQLSISYALRATLALATIRLVMNERWFLLFVTVLALLITFLPSMIERNYRIRLPTELELFLTIFIYASMYLGEEFNYYYRYPWWDMLLHGSSGVVIGVIGFLILYELYTAGKIKGNPATIALFSFSFALAIGALWEIFEFTMDVGFGLNMQKGLLNTMRDLILDTLGAIIGSLLGFLYLKGIKNPIFKGPIVKFVENNPHIFRKKHR